jgi:hypothetical protein
MDAQDLEYESSLREKGLTETRIRDLVKTTQLLKEQGRFLTRFLLQSRRSRQN